MFVSVFAEDSSDGASQSSQRKNALTLLDPNFSNFQRGTRQTRVSNQLQCYHFHIIIYIVWNTCVLGYTFLHYCTVSTKYMLQCIFVTIGVIAGSKWVLSIKAYFATCSIMILQPQIKVTPCALLLYTLTCYIRQ